MSSPIIKASMLKGSDKKNLTFILKEQILLSYGKSTVYVYPPIVEGMSNAEKSYAYMMNKVAILTADINPRPNFRHSAIPWAVPPLLTSCRPASLTMRKSGSFRPLDSTSTHITLATGWLSLTLRKPMENSSQRMACRTRIVAPQIFNSLGFPPIFDSRQSIRRTYSHIRIPTTSAYR